MSNKMVLIEYTETVESSAGRADEDGKKFTIEKGTKRYVDAASARKLTEGKGARAKLVDGKVDEAPKPRTRPSTSEPSANSPAHTEAPAEDGDTADVAAKDAG